MHFVLAKIGLPCWSGSALRDTMALMAGKVMLDIAATAPAAHIILRRTSHRFVKDY